MSKFKVEDIVRKTSGIYIGYCMSVTAIDATCLSGVVIKESYCGGRRIGDITRADKVDYELVEPSKPQETEAERLLHTLKEGNAARVKLCTDYPGLLEYSSGDTWHTVPNHRHVYRLKPQPTFIPFTVGSNWRVQFRDNTLTVGCKAIPAKEAKKILTLLCRQRGPAYAGGNYTAFGTRDGINFEGYVLEWAACDLILWALENAGV